MVTVMFAETLGNLEIAICFNMIKKKGNWIPMFQGNVAFSSSIIYEDISTNFRI
jgi:hypothetical protein